MGCDRTAAAVIYILSIYFEVYTEYYAITRHTSRGWERVAGRVRSNSTKFHNDPLSRLRSYETLRVKRASM